MSPNEWDFKQLAPKVTPENASKYGGWIILGVVVIVLLATSFYTVGTDERGVVLRFGRLVRITQPGLHAKLPLRFEIVKTPRVERVFKEEFGFQTLRAGIETIYSKKDLTGVSLMVCGDLNVAQVEWAVHYKIEKPEDFLFKVRSPRIIIRDASEAVMRRIVGDSSVDEVLTTRRTEINIEFKEALQRKMEEYQAGIRIDDVKLQSVVPPEKVKPAFDDVNTALQDKERFINQAQEEYNRVIAEAEGEARQAISQAQAYQIDRVNVAKGDAKRFDQILKEYKKAKDVTRKRLYLETMAKVLPKIEKKYIIDEEIKSLLPLLKLGEE